MSFQTTVFRDGAWVTETVDFQAALKASASAEKPQPPSDHPPCGILSSTVVGSPVVHQILPVRLRSKHHNDIALIGDYTVTIRELRNNGQTEEILKYRNFGSRIRKAVVLGPRPDESLDEASGAGGPDQVDGIDSIYQSSPTSLGNYAYPALPPQILVLVLSTGEMVFLFIREVNAKLEFCVNEHALSGNVPYLGYHLAVDPSSRFIAAASFEEMLVVYELEPRETLNERYMATGSLGNPFKSIRYRTLRGTIYDVQFLYPRPQDDYHIILMVILSSKSRDPSQQANRRYIIWDWEVGDDLRPILARSGHRQALAKSGGVPMFSIPLKSRNAFFVVYPTHIALVKESLSCAEYDANSVLEGPGPSTSHHGTDTPLWTSWARPFRRKEYYEKTDIIYLAREDGVIFHIEIDSPTLVYSTMELGSVGTNIGTAFTTAYDRFSDLFIIGGESAAGGIWKLAARSELERVNTFSNWSPVVDLTTVSDHVRLGTAESGGLNGAENQLHQRRDRLFFASGRGEAGSLVELRVGFKARIGTELDIGHPIKQAWLFADKRTNDGSMYAVLAQPHCTTILHFAPDFADVTEESAEITSFDIASCTLHSSQTPGGVIVQVSERSITLITASQSSRHCLSDLIRDQDPLVEKAFSLDDAVVISVQSPEKAQLHILRIEQMDVTLSNTWTISGEVSCVSQFQFCDRKYVVVGSVVDEGPLLSIYSLDGRLVIDRRVGTLPDDTASLEALTSISVMRETDEIVDIMAGTRCGHLLTIRISHDSIDPVSWIAERLGNASVDVFSSADLFNGDASAFAICDNSLIRLSAPSPTKLGGGQKDIVWPTDVSDPSLPAPPIHSVFTMRTATEGLGDKHVLLLLSGTRLYVADIEPWVGPVPRSIPLGRTATRVMFSNIWKCLVVAVQKDKGVDLVLIDPDTGREVSTSLGADKKPGALTSFARLGDKILGLHEWNYVKDGQTFPFIVVAMQSGKLVIVSVGPTQHPEEAPSGRHLEHWTRYRKKGYDDPVYSVTADHEGIIYCAGKTLYREVLDLAERKLKQVKVHELESPATSLDIVDGKLFALTTTHSVDILDYTSNPGKEEMILLHSDRVSRVAMHMTQVEHTMNASPRTVTVLSDMAGGISGVWVPQGQGNRDLVTVFEATLSNSVRRFVRPQCRPIWQSGGAPRLLFGSVPGKTDGSDMLGVSVDGTLRNFKLLTIELWRYLNLIQRLAQMSRATDAVGIRDVEGNEDMVDAEENPKNMHIEGDILAYCLEQQLLERMVSERGCLALFCQYLDALEGGIYTSGFAQSGAVGEQLGCKYFELGYDVLKYVLAPAL